MQNVERGWLFALVSCIGWRQSHYAAKPNSCYNTNMLPRTTQHIAKKTNPVVNARGIILLLLASWLGGQKCRPIRSVCSGDA